MLSGRQCNSLVRDKSQTLSNGSDSNNGERVTVQDFSIMKSQSHLGLDMEDIWTTNKRPFILSLMLTKNMNLCSVLTQQHQREESNSKKNGKQLVKLFLNLFQRRIWCTLMNNKEISQMSPTSREFGSTTENICSSYDSHTLLKKVKFLKKMLIFSDNSLISLGNQLSPCTFMQDSANSNTLRMNPHIRLLLELWRNSVSITLKSTGNQLNHTKSNSGINSM